MPLHMADGATTSVSLYKNRERHVRPSDLVIAASVRAAFPFEALTEEEKGKEGIPGKEQKNGSWDFVKLQRKISLFFFRNCTPTYFAFLYKICLYS
jgi:hypothetical protein